MKKKRIDLLNMTKNELGELLDKSNNKIKKLDYKLLEIWYSLPAIVIFAGLGLFFSSTLTLQVGTIAAIIMTLCTIVIDRLKTIECNKRDTIEQQLEDIITLDYERKRYSLEKQHEKSNDFSVNKLILNTQEKKELLQQYKDELSKYDISSCKNEINNELATQQYLIDNLQGIQKVKK